MNKPTPEQNNPTPKNQGPLIIILTVIITAVIIGGGVYLWQSSFSKTLLDKAKNNEQALMQQLDNLKTTLTSLSEEKIQDIKDTLKNNQEVYFKDTTIGLKLPKEYNIPSPIIPHYYEVQNTDLDLSLVSQGAEVLGHPKQMNLTDYCQKYTFTSAVSSTRCSEGTVQGHKIVNLYEASRDLGGSGLYFVSKIILIETNIPDYPILSLNYQKLPDYTQESGENKESVLETLINASTENLKYPTLVIFNDLDFIINNIEWNAPLENGTLPSGYIMDYECQSQGGNQFQDSNCGNETNLGKIYGEEGLICCK